MPLGLVPVTCPYCHSAQVITGGTTETGTQRYRCQQIDCSPRSFVLEPAYNGRLPQIKEQVLDMALNGSGIRDTARVLKISPTTVINARKKKRRRSVVSTPVCSLW
jgi:insertion element IS1 protein InsB